MTPEEVFRGVFICRKQGSHDPRYRWSTVSSLVIY